jgi:NTE family protein
LKYIVIFLLLLVVSTNAATSEDSSRVRIGLALSGGGALGFAHIGVLKVFEEAGIPISFISGISMGSLVGGVYAAGYKATQIESIATNADWSVLFSSNPSFGAQYLPERQQAQRYIIQLRHRNFFPALPSGLVPLQNVEFLLMKLLSEIEYNTYFDFDRLPISYRAVAVDLITGEKTIIKQGRLAQAIRASIAIPGVFAPEILDGKELVDGGVHQYLPVDPLMECNPDFIIAVLTMKHNPETGVSLIDVVSRTMDVVSIDDLNRQKRLADVLIEPNVDPFLHSDFARASELIAAGEAAARAALPEIRAKLAGRKLLSESRKVSSRTLPLIHSIRFEGLKITHPRLLYNEIRTRSCNYLNFGQLISDLKRLFDTGLFEDLNYRLEFTGEDWVDIIIELKEKAYGFYSLGLRYDNIDNVGLGIEVGQGNLWGSGASVRGVIQWGNPNEYRLGLTGTRLFRLPFGYRIDGFLRSLERSYYENGEWQADYNTDFRGGVAELGYILGRDGFFNIGFQAYEATYQMPQLSIFDTIPKKERIIGPSFLMEFNNFDDLFLPSRGRIYHLAGFLASKKLKSSNDFLKVDLSAERMIPITSWFLLKYSIEFGMSWQKLAWSEFFHTGGENLIGFAKDEFTTKQKAILRIGPEFRLFRLFNDDDYPFYLQLFSNISTFHKLNQLINNPQIDSTLNWGIGIGIRTNTPIGPFQFILGVADIAKPKPLPTTRVNVSFSVGRDFRYFKD